jgi:hypothetical protein
MPWHPIEVLVFKPLAIKHKIAALPRLTELSVIIQPGD